MLRCTCLVGMVIVIGCGSTEVIFPETEMVTLGAWTRPAARLDESIEVTYPKGSEILFYVGNEAQTETVFTFDGGSLTEKTVPGKSWSEVRLRVTGPNLRVMSGQRAAYMTKPHQLSEKKSDKPNVLLVCVDTLRADHFDAHHMPGLRRLFEHNGVIFSRAYSPVPWTLPAHASLFTSQYPASHGVRLPEHRLDETHQTLAETLAAHGYVTIGVTEGNYVSALYQLNQGFDAYGENSPDIASSEPSHASRLEPNLAILKELNAALNGLPKFIFFHTYEVHCPYLPRAGLSDPNGLGHTQTLLELDGTPLESDVVDQLRRLYAGEVRYCDRILTDTLKSLIAQDDWLVILLSDHGEEIGDHGGLLHADNVYEEAVRVPLAIMGAGVDVGELDHRVCSLLDVAPTIVELVQIDVPETWQGVSLLQSSDSSRDLFFESFFFGPHIPVDKPSLGAVLIEEMKYVEEHNFDRERQWLFDLQRDPDENRNACQAMQDLCGDYKTRVETYLSSPGTQAPSLDEIPQEQQDNLRGLGYLQ